MAQTGSKAPDSMKVVRATTQRIAGRMVVNLCLCAEADEAAVVATGARPMMATPRPRARKAPPHSATAEVIGDLAMAGANLYFERKHPLIARAFAAAAEARGRFA